MASGSRIVVVDYDMSVPGIPHANEPEMLIGPAGVAEWMRAAGFAPTREHDIFDDRFFIVYSKVE